MSKAGGQFAAEFHLHHRSAPLPQLCDTATFRGCPRCTLRVGRPCESQLLRCLQDPFVTPGMSFRDNVLFGEKFDQHRYQQVVIAQSVGTAAKLRVASVLTPGVTRAQVLHVCELGEELGSLAEVQQMPMAVVPYRTRVRCQYHSARQPPWVETGRGSERVICTAGGCAV